MATATFDEILRSLESGTPFTEYIKGQYFSRYNSCFRVQLAKRPSRLKRVILVASNGTRWECEEVGDMDSYPISNLSYTYDQFSGMLYLMVRPEEIMVSYELPTKVLENDLDMMNEWLKLLSVPLVRQEAKERETKENRIACASDRFSRAACIILPEDDDK